jgi:hypothetical protein
LCLKLIIFLLIVRFVIFELFQTCLQPKSMTVGMPANISEYAQFVNGRIHFYNKKEFMQQIMELLDGIWEDWKFNGGDRVGVSFALKNKLGCSWRGYSLY